MKKTSVILHSLAFVAGVASIASAVPFGVHDIAPFGLSVASVAQGGGGGSNAGQVGTFATQSIGNGIQPASVVNQTLPLPSALTLLGVGMAAWGLAGWLLKPKHQK